MDKLLISYKISYNDWYVMEIYRYIHQEFEKKYPNIKFEFVENSEMKKKYGIQDYENNHPSILNQYNFLIVNPKNGHTFINSLSDYAPLCLYPKSGVEKFDVKKFGFCSNYIENLIEPIRQYNPSPSFYILENFSDLEKLKKHRTHQKKIKKAIFLGLIYGRRETYQKIFEKSNLITVQSKSHDEYYKQKDEYYNLMSQYKMILSIDGAAKICYRDLEALGMGNLLVREHLEIATFEPLIHNIHYLEVLDVEEKNKLNSFNDESLQYYKNLIEVKITESLEDKNLIDSILNEGINWFDNNCLPDKQFCIIEKLTEKLSILF